MTIAVGTLIKNNDPRFAWTVPILEIVARPGVDAYAIVRPKGNNGRVCKVRLDRIHTDGKQRAQGYNVVSPGDVQVDRPLPAGVQVVSLENPAELHHTIARAVGEGMPDRGGHY